MLRRRVANRAQTGVAEPYARRSTDRAMDVLQYGMAILAFAGAVILGFLR